MEITRKFDHGKFGNFLFCICAKWTKFLVKHRWLYYLLACAWGSIQTLVGALITIVLAIVKIFYKKIYFNRFAWIYSISIGPKYWGGFEMGLMFVRDHKSVNCLNCHEFGHTISQLWVGPLYIFTIGLHSAIRYWVQTIREWKGNAHKNPPYSQYWAEDAADQCGLYAAWYIDEKKKEKEAK